MRGTLIDLHIMHCNLSEVVLANDDLTIRILPRIAMTLEQLEANARLVQVSPKIHKALQEIANFVNRNPWIGNDEKRVVASIAQTASVVATTGETKK